MLTPRQNTLVLQGLPLSNLSFHAIIEREIKESPFGQQTYNVAITNGLVQLETLNIVKQRRRKYHVYNKIDKKLDNYQ